MAKRKAQSNDLLNQETASTSTVAGSGKVLLKSSDGKRRFTLVDEKQKLTDFGKKYYEHTGETFQPHYDLEQTLIREKEKEYITFRNGQKKLARRLVDDSYNYTKIGRSFFRARGDTVEYLAHLPVTITGTNSKTGKKYTRIGHLPHTALDVSLKIDATLSNDQQEEEVRRLILKNTKDGILLEVSSEEYRLQEDGNWMISKLITRTSEDSELVTSAVIN